MYTLCDYHLAFQSSTVVLVLNHTQSGDSDLPKICESQKSLGILNKLSVPIYSKYVHKNKIIR